MINVTKTYLPEFEEYALILKRAWDKAWVTNNGELVQELEQELKNYLGVKHLFLTNNGTVVLQMALKALNITKEVITTPFSYVATTNAILWEGCTPVFVDINEDSFNIDTEKIEAAITNNTEAILATHVFGIPCNIEKLKQLAEKYNLKLIYDGAHAFGCEYKEKSLLSYGDISTCSFHATKLFHTVEGGCVICNDDELANKLMLYRQFGHVHDNYYSIGINAKNSEFHAAMGIAVLPKIKEIIEARKTVSELYSKLLNRSITILRIPSDVSYNYSYFPILFPDEKLLLNAISMLKEKEIYGRRYFYPSLNELPFLKYQSCSVSEGISRRILCLPLYFDLEKENVELIASIINKSITA